MGAMTAIGAAVVSGVLYFLGFTGFGYWPLIFVFLVPVFVASEGRGGWAAFGLGEIAGTVAMYGGFYWVAHLLQIFAHLNLPLALLGLTLLCVYNGGTVGLEVWIYTRLQRRGWPRAVCGAVAMTATETVYPLLFPNYAANALYKAPIFIQPVELFGMAALGVLVGGVNGALAGAFVERGGRARELGWAAALLFGFALYGAVRIPMIDAQVQDAPTLETAMVQANLGAEQMKTVPRRKFADTHRQMSFDAYRAHPDLDLIVWPESGYGSAIDRSRSDLLYVTEGVPVPVLFGATTVAFEEGGGRRVYNSAILTSTTGARIGRFDKIRLLMFGETLPFIDTFPELKEWFPQSGRFDRGTDWVHLRHPDGWNMLPMVCYEDLLPDFVRELTMRAGPPDVLVNITNDSWYGDTHEPRTHLALSIFRTVETRRAMIRSTNTGISAFVDPVGRIVAQTGQRTKETLVYDVPLRPDAGRTPFLIMGNVLGWACVLLALVGAWMPRRALSPSRS